MAIKVEKYVPLVSGASPAPPDRVTTSTADMGSDIIVTGTVLYEDRIMADETETTDYGNN